MESYNLRGKICELWPTQQKTEKFRKREFVVEVNSTNERGTFIEYILLQLVQNNCDELDSFNIGDMVIVRWSLMGRKWGKKGEEKYFTNVEALEITMITKGDGTGNDVIEDQLPLGDDALFEIPKNDSIPNDELDDLPF